MRRRRRSVFVVRAPWRARVSPAPALFPADPLFSFSPLFRSSRPCGGEGATHNKTPTRKGARPPAPSFPFPRRRRRLARRLSSQHARARPLFLRHSSPHTHTDTHARTHTRTHAHTQPSFTLLPPNPAQTRSPEDLNHTGPPPPLPRTQPAKNDTQSRSSCSSLVRPPLKGPPIRCPCFPRLFDSGGRVRRGAAIAARALLRPPSRARQGETQGLSFR